MSQNFLQPPVINIATTLSAKKKIFEDSPPAQQIKNFLSVPQQEQQDQQDVNHFVTDQSEIVPHEIVQNTLPQPEQSQRQSILQDLQNVTLDDLDNFLAFFKQTHPMSQSISNLNSSQINHQYYTQLELEGERLRDRLRQDAKVVNTILEKQKKIKTKRIQLSDELRNDTNQLLQVNECTRYKQFNKGIKHQFNQIESKYEELKDVYNEAYNFMQVLCIVIHERQQQSFIDQNVTENEFTSTTLKLYTDIQKHSKMFEQKISEQRSLLAVSEDHAQFKQVCQALLGLINEFPQYEQQKQEQMLQVQKVASQYFKQYCQEIMEETSKYQTQINDLRQSIASINKFEYLKSLIKKPSEHIFTIEDLGKQFDESGYLEFKRIEREIKLFDISQYKYFSKMRHKMQSKCIVYIEEVNQDYISLKQEFNQMQRFYNQYQQFDDEQFINSMNELIDQQQAHLTKEGWLQLIQYHKELVAQLQSIDSIVCQINQANINHVQINQFKGQLVENLQNKKQQQYQINPQIDNLLIIQDIDAQIEYNRLQIQFRELQVNFDTILQTINSLLPLQLNYYDMEIINQKRIEFKKQFTQIHTFQDQFNLVITKKIIGNPINIKQKLQMYQIFEKDTDCLLEQIQYLHLNNIQSIFDDFNELDNKSNSSLKQLEEVIIEAIKKIELIQSPQLNTIKQSQLKGFRWICEFFKQLIEFRTELIKLVQKSESIQEQFSVNQELNGIPIEQYQQFTQKHKYSYLYYYLNLCPKSQNWIPLQQELIQMLMKIFKQYIYKVLMRIDLSGQQDHTYLMNLDQEKLEQIQRNLIYQEDGNSGDIYKGVLIFQTYKRIKNQLNQQQLVDQKLRQLQNDVILKMDETIKKLNSQFPDIQYIINFIKDDQDDQRIYILFQQEWAIQYLSQQDLSFIQDLCNFEGLFNQCQSEIFFKIKDIYEQQPMFQWQNIKLELGYI